MGDNLHHDEFNTLGKCRYICKSCSDYIIEEKNNEDEITLYLVSEIDVQLKKCIMCMQDNVDK